MTTYPTSTAQAAKAWLFGQMQTTLTAASDATFEVTYATQVDTINSPDDQVYMGKIANRVVSNFAMVGNLGQWSLQEEYDLEVYVSCWRGGNQPDVAEARAWALAGSIETIARTDPTLGANVLTSRPNMSDSDVDWDEAGNGRIATVTLSIHCLATL